MTNPTIRVDVWDVFVYSGCPRVYGTATGTACEQDRGRAAVGTATAATIRIVQGDAESDGYPRARPRHDRQHPGGLGECLYPFQYTVNILCGRLGMAPGILPCASRATNTIPGGRALSR